MSTIALLPLSDAFEAVWPDLAAELGLSIERVTTPEALARHTGIGVVAAGGEEDALAAALRPPTNGGGQVVAVGALASHRLAVSALQAGAADYFALPQDFDLLRGWLRQRAGDPATREQRSDFAQHQRERYAFHGILGTSPALRAALGMAERVIPHRNVTVLVTGETGTGKELVARAIHYEGPRREGPFVDINCTAIPEQLLESELFGHERGAFTGATTAKPGLFEVAHGGTLFLDEIGHLAPLLQGKLLRALEEHAIRRVGGQHSLKVDVRVIAATHVDLASAVREQTFRADLYHRLNVMRLALPPLRHRREDILPLAANALARLAAEYDRPPPILTGDASRLLIEYAWPGNVRELRNAMERALLLSNAPEIAAADLQFLVSGAESASGAHGPLSFPGPLNALMKSAAAEMIALCGGNKSEAARRLGISRPRLMRLTQPHDSGDCPNV